eukprot:5209443-Pleurochrysis_carterae.AAC.1
MNRPDVTSLTCISDAAPAQSVEAPAASRLLAWPERARQQLLLFPLNPVIGVARPPGPCNGIEFRDQLYNFIFCPSQS